MNNLEHETDTIDQTTMMSMQYQHQQHKPTSSSSPSQLRQPQLRRRFSREEDGSNSEEVLNFLQRSGSSVSELEIVSETIHDDDVADMEQVLIHHHRAIHLTHLELPKNGLTAAAGRPIANILQAQHETLTSLSLAHNPITSTGLAALVDALSTESIPPSRLMELDLSDTKLIGSKGATVIASILRTNTSIRTLNLSKNDLGTKGIRVLAPALVSHVKLRQLDLSYNNIKPRGATLLAQALEANSNNSGRNSNTRYDEETYEERGLRSINLTCNRIGAQGVQALCDVLKFHRTIEVLSCGKNELLPEGGAYVAYLLKSNYRLRWIDLQDNQIGPAAASLLAEQLTEDNRTLEYIDLSYNDIGQQGAHDLADALMKNESLQHCLLDGNQIDSPGAISLANALNYNLTLTSLSLAHNRIDNDGAFAIANALGKPTCHIQINCSDNPIGPEGQASLDHAPQLHRNRKFWLDEILKGICKGHVSNVDMQRRCLADEEIILLSRALEERWAPTTTGCPSSSFMSSSSLASMADVIETPIRTMYINGANLTSRSLIPLIQATLPSSAKVLRLYLRDCQTDDPSFIDTISRCLSLSTSLEVFSLVGCDLGENDAISLARGVRTNMTLRRLNLDRNNICDGGIKAIIHAIHNHPTLTSFSAAGNGITDACMEMSEGLMGLIEINLDDCNITDRGALDFCRFLMGSNGDEEINKCKLDWVSLSRNKLSKRGGETIKTFLGGKATVIY